MGWCLSLCQALLTHSNDLQPGLGGILTETSSKMCSYGVSEKGNGESCWNEHWENEREKKMGNNFGGERDLKGRVSPTKTHADFPKSH